MQIDAIACTNCGVNKGKGTNYCPSCGVTLSNPNVDICISCGSIEVNQI